MLDKDVGRKGCGQPNIGDKTSVAEREITKRNE
jgi:hypothetical protein